MVDWTQTSKPESSVTPWPTATTAKISEPSRASVAAISACADVKKSSARFAEDIQTKKTTITRTKRITRMCDFPNQGPTTAVGCLNGCGFLCAAIEHCQHAKKYGTAKLTRLCSMHVAFCRYCGKPFCADCVELHGAHCPQKPRPESLKSVAELVESALGRMGT